MQYEAPVITEVGSVRELTLDNALGFGNDGWFPFFKGTKPGKPGNPGLS